MDISTGTNPGAAARTPGSISFTPWLARALAALCLLLPTIAGAQETGPTATTETECADGLDNDRDTVYGFAKHWETGEPLPEEMFEKLKEQKNYGAGMMMCRQNLFGQLSRQ